MARVHRSTQTKQKNHIESPVWPPERRGERIKGEEKVPPPASPTHTHRGVQGRVLRLGLVIGGEDTQSQRFSKRQHSRRVEQWATLNGPYGNERTPVRL